MKSWKTSLTGILTIVIAVGKFVLDLIQGTSPDFAVLIAAVVAGIGLISAKDSQVTGGTIRQ